MDPNQRPLTDTPNFLETAKRESFENQYAEEREYQIKAISNSGDSNINISECFFANEALQLYSLFKTLIEERDCKFYRELQAALPKSLRFYKENINFQEFE